MPEPKKSSLAASALKVILIFGSGAAAWALITRWLTKEKEAEGGIQDPTALPAAYPGMGMPQFVPMPYPFAIPQMAPQAPMAAPIRNASIVVEEAPPQPRRRRSGRKLYSDMDADEVFEAEIEKIRKRRAKESAHTFFDDEDLRKAEDDLLEQFVSN